MIGANNYGFAAIVERCVTNWATSPSWFKNYCSDDSDMTSRFTAARQDTETANVSEAFKRVAQAMNNAGYNPSQYTIIAQTYWSPIPRGSGFRYPETGWTRQAIGGCGTWNRDADWANDTVVTAMNNTVKNGAAGPASRTSSRSTSSTRSSAGGCASPASACWRRPAPRAGRARARSTAASGSSRSGR